MEPSFGHNIISVILGRFALFILWICVLFTLSINLNQKNWKKKTPDYSVFNWVCPFFKTYVTELKISHFLNTLQMSFISHLLIWSNSWLIRAGVLFEDFLTALTSAGFFQSHVTVICWDTSTGLHSSLKHRLTSSTFVIL